MLWGRESEWPLRVPGWGWRKRGGEGERGVYGGLSGKLRASSHRSRVLGMLECLVHPIFVRDVHEVPRFLVLGVTSIVLFYWECLLCSIFDSIRTRDETTSTTTRNGKSVVVEC